MSIGISHNLKAHCINKLVSENIVFTQRTLNKLLYKNQLIIYCHNTHNIVQFSSQRKKKEKKK